jgi:subtilisin family serine protease
MPGYTDREKIIAVIDAGFTNANTLMVFDSLYNSGRILGAVDFAENGANVYSAHSHGTMVLSIMGGNIP